MLCLIAGSVLILADLSSNRKKRGVSCMHIQRGRSVLWVAGVVDHEDFGQPYFSLWPEMLTGAK